MLWGRREMFTVTQHAGLGLAKHLLDWAGVHTGHSAEAAVTIAAEAVAAVDGERLNENMSNGAQGESGKRERKKEK